MLEGDPKYSRSSGRTPVPIDPPVHRELRAVRRFSGNRRLQILNNPRSPADDPERLPSVRSSQNEESGQKFLCDSTDELHSSVNLTIAKDFLTDASER